MVMENKDTLNILKKCINDKCDEKCPLHKNDNCQHQLLDILFYKLGVLPKDYIDYLKEKGIEE